MKNSKPVGVKIWEVKPCDSGFGEYQATGACFVKKSSIQPNTKIDGLIRNQTGPAITAETHDGIPVIGMMV